MAKKLPKPDLKVCASCAQSGKCPACKGSGKDTKQIYGFALKQEKTLTISCRMCGKGEVVGEDKHVYKGNSGKLGNGDCKDCSGLGWVVKKGKLKVGKK